jgi:hypothetical protein
MNDSTFSRTERYALWCVALLGLFGVNGAFLYGLAEPGLLEAAFENPISLAFMAEALVLMCVLAYLLTRWGVTGMRWTWFVLFALIGSLAFALPLAALYGNRRDRPLNA